MPNSTFGFPQAAAGLAALAHDLGARQAAGLKDCALIVTKAAKENINHGRPEWPALKPISLSLRRSKLSRGVKSGRQGRTEDSRSANRTPLLDVGRLMKDIHEECEPTIAVIGCSLKYAPPHEFGARIKVTRRMRAYLHFIGIHLKPSTTHITIPKRAFLVPAAHENLDQMRAAMIRALGGAGS
jgi:phage gpG-like protein